VDCSPTGDQGVVVEGMPNVYHVYPGKGRGPLSAIFGLLSMTGAAPVGALQDVRQDVYVDERLNMVRTQIESRGVTDSATLAAMRTVPRHEFVTEEWRSSAYSDGPLPIGEEQTISQPYVVALMTERLALGPGEKVLEVGTGSGYQAAVLAEVGARVFTIEIFESLAREADERLGRLGYDRVDVRHGDGYLGWPEQAPFDAIIVTAAPDAIPQPLVDQLRPGGRMIIPVGPEGAVQELVLLRKGEDGSISTESVSPVRFVPLLRETPR
jgi:protein-L-isoaspartate(D-aspartate) O-methyltransferase